MNLDRFQEMTGREEEDIELCENICDTCGKDADNKCPYWRDISKCGIIENRHDGDYYN